MTRRAKAVGASRHSPDLQRAADAERFSSPAFRRAKRSVCLLEAGGANDNSMMLFVDASTTRLCYDGRRLFLIPHPGRGVCRCTTPVAMLRTVGMLAFGRCHWRRRCPPGAGIQAARMTFARKVVTCSSESNGSSTASAMGTWATKVAIRRCLEVVLTLPGAGHDASQTRMRRATSRRLATYRWFRRHAVNDNEHSLCSSRTFATVRLTQLAHSLSWSMLTSTHRDAAAGSSGQ